MKTEAKLQNYQNVWKILRDINIAIANELTKICAEIDINVLEVIKLANQHPRVNILNPGPGVGGHCLAIDPYFIYSKTPETAKIIKLARDTNKSMPDFIVKYANKIVKHYSNLKRLKSQFLEFHIKETLLILEKVHHLKSYLNLKNINMTSKYMIRILKKRNTQI